MKVSITLEDEADGGVRSSAHTESNGFMDEHDESLAVQLSYMVREYLLVVRLAGRGDAQAQDVMDAVRHVSAPDADEDDAPTPSSLH